MVEVKAIREDGAEDKALLKDYMEVSQWIQAHDGSYLRFEAHTVRKEDPRGNQDSY